MFFAKRRRTEHWPLEIRQNIENRWNLPERRKCWWVDDVTNILCTVIVVLRTEPGMHYDTGWWNAVDESDFLHFVCYMSFGLWFLLHCIPTRHWTLEIPWDTENRWNSVELQIFLCFLIIIGGSWSPSNFSSSDELLARSNCHRWGVDDCHEEVRNV